MHLMLDIDTKHFTLYRHIIAASGMQKKPQSIVLIQQMIWSNKRKVWAPVESVDKKYLHWWTAQGCWPRY